MYSIFSTRTEKHNYLEEGEPPPKKLVTEKDILIKKLAENQLKTSTTLTEQLNKEKEFILSASFTNITSFLSGKTELKDFQTKLASVDELNNFKSKGLSDTDIEIYREYTNLGPEFWVKYKGVSKVCKRISEIKETLTRTGDFNQSNSIPTTSGHSEKHRIIVHNRKKEYLPNPMDELQDLEKQIMDDLEEYSSCDIKKIRKKARSMGSKIKNLESSQNILHTDNCKASDIKNKNSQRPTLWDVKEKPNCLEKKIEIIDKDKIYSCKPQNWYTIKDGQIIKLDDNKAIPRNLINTQSYAENSKLTLEEIKNIPKFTNYEPGTPSKVLYLKNLGKNVTESCVRNLLREIKKQCYSVKVMSGKMKGQAFIEFQDAAQASNALEVLNGVVVEGKPIIVQYGKNKET